MANASKLNIDHSRDIYWGRISSLVSNYKPDDDLYLCASFEYLAHKVFNKADFTRDEVDDWFVTRFSNPRKEYKVEGSYVILALSPEGYQNCKDFLDAMVTVKV